MLTEKNKQLKVINIITWLILAGVTLASYFMPLNGNNVLTLETKFPGPLVGPAFVWYLFFLSLVVLGLFTWFQARSNAHQELLRFKARYALGWTVGASFLLYSLATVLWHFEKFGWTIFLLILTTLVLFSVNSNIRDDADLVNEKFWIRNPFSIFSGWVFYFLMMTIAMKWQATFSIEMPAFLLLAASLVLVIWYSFVNLNSGVLFVWVIILILKLIQNPGPQTITYAIWGGLVALIISIYFITRLTPYAKGLHKPVTKAMDKYNYGKPSQLEALEDDLNEALQVKPGDRINLK